MITARFTLLAALLLVACSSSEAKKPGLPPAKAESSAPAIPGPPAPSKTGLAGNNPANQATTGRFIATALPKHMAELGPKMSGTLSAVMVDEGDRVRKGQALFRLNTQSIQLNISSADAALAGAKIARDNAQRELERQKVLAEKGTISAAVLERAESAYTAASNGVNQAEVGLSMARRGNTDSAVYSPIDGIVAKKLKSVGETVTMMPPTTVVIIQDQSVLEVRARIPEVALRTVKEGDMITAYFTALEINVPAKIVRVQPTVDPITRTIEIVADIANKDGKLRPGMFVEVELKPPVVDYVDPPLPDEAPVETTKKPAKKTSKKKDAP